MRVAHCYEVCESGTLVRGLREWHSGKSSVKVAVIKEINPLDLKSSVDGRLFTPQVGCTRPYILASEFDLFQRRSLGDTFETHLT